MEGHRWGRDFSINNSFKIQIYQGCQDQGKVREKQKFLKVREKSGKIFDIVEVREKSGIFVFQYTVHKFKNSPPSPSRT